MHLKELVRRIALNNQKEAPFPQSLDDYLKDFIPNHLFKSQTLQEAYDLSDNDLETLYKEAYEKYNQEEYESSTELFRLLVSLNPFIPKFWLGLGANQQMQEFYHEALHSYAALACIDSENAYAHFYAYECYVALHDQEDARKALELAYKRAKSQPIYEDLLQEILRIRVA